MRARPLLSWGRVPSCPLLLSSHTAFHPLPVTHKQNSLDQVGACRQRRGFQDRLGQLLVPQSVTSSLGLGQPCGLLAAGSWVLILMWPHPLSDLFPGG